MGRNNFYREYISIKVVILPGRVIPIEKFPNGSTLKEAYEWALPSEDQPRRAYFPTINGEKRKWACKPKHGDAIAFFPTESAIDRSLKK